MQNQQVITLTTSVGKQIQAFQDDAITERIKVEGEYDSNTLDSLREILALIQPKTSLDVGANIGNHALIIADLSEKIIAFEPVRVIFSVLQRNFQINKALNSTAVNMGLSDTNGIREIYIPKNGNLGSSSLELGGATADCQQIETVIGDAYLEAHGINDVDFIKMDVEGHEAAALAGLKATILKSQPLLLIEWKSAETIERFKAHDLFNALFSDYCIYSLSSTYSKKAYASSLINSIKRICCKLFYRKWCLASFDATKKYSNIYLVPKRYAKLFEKFRYLTI